MLKAKLDVKIVLFFIVGLMLTSCGSKKVLYNPVEVNDLSQKLKIEISNDDKNMPLYAEVSQWLGVRYKSAGVSKKGVDCSGFAHLIYQKVYGVAISRSSSEQANMSHKVSKNRLETGDLVFFATNSKNRNRINHVGIYLKEDKFIHASTSRGVIVSSLKEKYYIQSWRKGGKIKR